MSFCTYFFHLCLSPSYEYLEIFFVFLFFLCIQFNYAFLHQVIFKVTFFVFLFHSIFFLFSLSVSLNFLFLSYSFVIHSSSYHLSHQVIVNQPQSSCLSFFLSLSLSVNLFLFFLSLSLHLFLTVSFLSFSLSISSPLFLCLCLSLFVSYHSLLFISHSHIPFLGNFRAFLMKGTEGSQKLFLQSVPIKISAGLPLNGTSRIDRWIFG